TRETVAPRGAERGRRAAAARDAGVTEDGAEELGEIPEVTVLDVAAARTRTGARPRGALPVRSEGVVPPALFGVGEHLVGLGDLAEALAFVLALRDIRVVL